MKKVFLYNPENDIALSHGSGNFTPPKNALALSRYASPVMWWVAGEGDYIIVPDDMPAGYMNALDLWQEQARAVAGCKGAEIITSARNCDVSEAVPWGWSRHAVRRLLSAGVDAAVVSLSAPDADKVRDLSHRRTASGIVSRLCDEVDFMACGNPVPWPAMEVREWCGVEQFASKHGDFYCKMPWSSSGRGVRRVTSDGLHYLKNQFDGMIKAQGSVMLEPAYDKTDDFAMLFEARDGKVRFHGYSLFFNDRGEAYGGNLIASDAEIRQFLAKKVSGDLLEQLAAALERILSDTVGSSYQGFMGVDMMIARDGTSHFIVPCVELNLRMTMGVVAHSVGEKLRNAGHTGRRLMRMAVGGSADDVFVQIVPQNNVFGIGLSAL
ncbi:MAG: hypothetical protein K2H14_00880 [Muribaculaceae bacterium]|nr:hypothetical protein [Muribaculaceae bacterium]